MTGAGPRETDLLAEADGFARRNFSLLRRFAMRRDRARADRSRQASTILAHWSGARPSASRLCLFAHFDPQGRIDPTVTYYLQALRAAGFDVVLVSSSPTLVAEDVEATRPLCRDIFHRTNVAMDFGAWHDAVLRLADDVARCEELLLANDSVYGPLVPLAPIIATMRAGDNDFWGMTDCHVLGQHLQSYFLLLRRPVLLSSTFKRFWQEFVFFRNKDNIIRDYEVGLTARLAADGFRPQAFCRAEDVAQGELQAGQGDALIDRRARGRALNSSIPITYWKALVLRHGYPFVKRELVRDNPFRLPSVADVPAVLRQAGGYQVDLIRSHLKRLGQRSML
jgi:lipopolysaccharide biosynthesis protein